MNAKNDAPDLSRPPATPAGRLPYAAPALVVHGTVEQMTAKRLPGPDVGRSRV